MGVIDSKRIAKNTVALYVRMAFSMLVSLYTSRVVLEVLGVDDYGVYNAVGGVVALLGFLNTSMSSATSRFLTFEIGRNNTKGISDIFSAAFVIHGAIAFVMLILLETIGLWFLNNKLVIPSESMTAANWVYQFSIISCVISITQVPYNATIIAYERMDVYAYVEILNVILKLVIVYLLYAINANKLFLYGLLLTSVSALIALIYRVYCLRSFTTCRFHFVRDYKIYKPMLTFSGWDLYGNASVVARVQGVNILLNMFFGPLANAAAGIGATVQGAVSSFTGNVMTAVRPQIIKSYALGEVNQMIRLIYSSCRVLYSLLLVISLPLLLETNYVLSIWLTEVPKYTVGITRLTILFLYFSNISYVVVTGLHATGNIKRPSFINGTLYLTVLPICYAAYKLSIGSVYLPFILNASFVLIGAIINLYSLRIHIDELPVGDFFTSVLGRCLTGSLLALLAPAAIVQIMPESFVRFLWVCFIGIAGSAVISYYVIMTPPERQLIKRFIINVKSKIITR